MLGHVQVKMSEAAISEFLIAPVLKEVWRHYDDTLLLWSHVALTAGEEFDGYPDYLFTKRTALGMVREKPYLLVVEAKKDDFEGGWGGSAWRRCWRRRRSMAMSKLSCTGRFPTARCGNLESCKRDSSCAIRSRSPFRIWLTCLRPCTMCLNARSSKRKRTDRGLVKLWLELKTIRGSN